MLYTSAEANKLMKRLMDERNRILGKEKMTETFVAATTEDVEAVRPEYDFFETQTALWDVEAKIRKVKHAINVFNTTQYVGDTGMTVDEVLVYLPQLTSRKANLSEMIGRLPKARKRPGYGDKSNFIEYEYANYDIAQAKTEYEAISDLISKTQIKLDRTNTTVTMEIDV